MDLRRIMSNAGHNETSTVKATLASLESIKIPVRLPWMGEAFDDSKARFLRLRDDAKRYGKRRNRNAFDEVCREARKEYKHLCTIAGERKPKPDRREARAKPDTAQTPEATGRYCYVPHQILSGNISNSEFAIWMALAALEVEQGTAIVTVGLMRLARLAGVTLNTIKAVVSGEPRAFRVVGPNRYEIEPLRDRMARAETNGGYAKVWLTTASLKPGPLRFWCALHRFEQTTYSQGRLAIMCNTTSRTVRDWTRTLEAHGLISISRGPRGLAIKRKVNGVSKTSDQENLGVSKTSDQKVSKTSDQVSNSSGQGVKNFRQMKSQNEESE